MARITINVVLDLGQLMNVARYSKNNRPTLLKILGEQYAYHLREKFVQYSLGQGDWPELAESTVESKIARGIANNPHAMLRETGKYLAQLWYRIRGDTVYVGWNRSENLAGRDNSEISATTLARLHEGGTARMPARSIIGPMSESDKQKLVVSVLKEYNKQIRRGKK